MKEHSCNCGNAGQAGPPRVGVLGGTFHPVHTAHIVMARAAKAEFALDIVLLIPANDPPHKLVEHAVPAARRLHMVELAVQGEPGLMACDIECRRQGKSYTVDTLRELRGAYPGSSLFLIVGSDMLHDLPNWKNAEEVLRVAVVIAVAREGGDAITSAVANDAAAAEELRARYGAKVYLSTAKAPPYSSTDIRRRLHNALPVEGMLPPAVEEYIYQTGLYLPPQIDAMRAKLAGMLKPHRYAHTMGVVRAAAALAERFHVEPRKARLAALLHDCGKALDSGALTHAETGARVAREQFGVRAEDVLRAIRRHTTLGAGATALDKIIYLADLIEPGREYPGVEALRALARQNLDRAVYAGLRQTVDYVRGQGKQVDEASLAAMQELAQCELAQCELAQCELAQCELAQCELAQRELAQRELGGG